MSRIGQGHTSSNQVSLMRSPSTLFWKKKKKKLMIERGTPVVYLRSFRLHLDQSMSHLQAQELQCCNIAPSATSLHLHFSSTSKFALQLECEISVHAGRNLEQVASQLKSNLQLSRRSDVDKHDSVKDGEIGCDILHGIRGFSVDPRTN